MPYKLTDEDERDIEIMREARVRAHRQIRKEERKEEQDANCAQGKHAKFENKKCVNCGAAEPAPEPETHSPRRRW